MIYLNRDWETYEVHPEMYIEERLGQGIYVPKRDGIYPYYVMMWREEGHDNVPVKLERFPTKGMAEYFMIWLLTVIERDYRTGNWADFAGCMANPEFRDVVSEKMNLWNLEEVEK